MPRLLPILMLALCLGFAGQARAQATADQLNKLSLEALTAPPAPGSYHPAFHHTGARPYRAAPTRSRWAAWHGTRSYLYRGRTRAYAPPARYARRSTRIVAARRLYASWSERPLRSAAVRRPSYHATRSFLYQPPNPPAAHGRLPGHAKIAHR